MDGIWKSSALLFLLIAAGEGLYILGEHLPAMPKSSESVTETTGGDHTVHPTEAAAVSSPFIYSFNTEETLEEAGDMDESSSPYLWLNSGAYLFTENGIGRTVRGSLLPLSYWRLLYNKTSARDTDNGAHPQNLFRLVSRSKWNNVRWEAYFRVDADNLSDSTNRNESNGLLLFTHYQNGDNLYYAGIRVDGGAVIKKKKDGIYYTLAYRKAITGRDYNRKQNPSLIRKNEWIGLRVETTPAPNGGVHLMLYADQGETGTWTPILEAIDDGSMGGPAINTEGCVGIRTDFMDVSFKSLKAELL